MSLWRVGWGWDTDAKVDGLQLAAPVYKSEDPVSDIPRLFYDTHGRNWNDCVHAKQTSLKGVPLMGTYVAGGYLLTPFHVADCTQWTVQENFANHNTFWIAGPRITVQLNIAMSHYNVPTNGPVLAFRVVIQHTYGSNGGQIGEVLYKPSAGAWIDPSNNMLESSTAVMLQALIIPYYDYLEYNYITRSGSRIPARAVQEILLEIYHYVEKYSSARPGWPFVARRVSSPVAFPALTEQDLKGGFLLGEQNIVSSGVPGVSFGTANYWLNFLKQHSFFEACEAMPRLSDNSISNIQEIFEFILSIIRREPPKIPKSLGDAWLAYRYQYSTTKMDIQEAIGFVSRYADLSSFVRPIDTRGIGSADIADATVVCRCQVTLMSRELYTLDECLHDLRKAWYNASMLGLAPDLYYLWDSTPFSFIADWFLPIGNVLAVQDASLLYTGSHYDFRNIGYTLSYERTIKGRPCRYFSRWAESSPPQLSGFYWIEGQSASNKQLLYRALDTKSLFLR
jgi:hypothetical protein